VERVEGARRSVVTADSAKFERVRAAVDRFLRLVEAGSVDPAKNEMELAACLDELAWVIREIPRNSSSEFSLDPDEAGDVAALRRIPERFPDFGYYSMVDPVAPGETEPEIELGDAIDDVSDITRDLLRVRRIWDEIGEAEGLWELRFSFESHWEHHLRRLQLYLLPRRSPLWGA
jgi:hypothetical protein